jgi:hypothetical protein
MVCKRHDNHSGFNGIVLPLIGGAIVITAVTA